MRLRMCFSRSVKKGKLFFSRKWKHVFPPSCVYEMETFFEACQKIKTIFSRCFSKSNLFSQGVLGKEARKKRESLVFFWGLKRVKNFNLQRSDAESAPGAKKCLVRNLTIMIISKEDQNILFQPYNLIILSSFLIKPCDNPVVWRQNGLLLLTPGFNLIVKE